MSDSVAMQQPRHLDESQFGESSADVFSRVASEHRPVIVQRGGLDFAAVVPLEYLDLVQDSLARQEAERLAAEIEWTKRSSGPPQEWFEGDEPKPF